MPLLHLGIVVSKILYVYCKNKLDLFYFEKYTVSIFTK